MNRRTISLIVLLVIIIVIVLLANYLPAREVNLIVDDQGIPDNGLTKAQEDQIRADLAKPPTVELSAADIERIRKDLAKN